MASSKDPSGRRRSRASSLQNPTVDIYGRRIKKVHYENTYRLEPKTLFPVEKAKAIIKDLVDGRLENKLYDPDKCMSLCKSLANDIKDHIKDLFVSLFSLVFQPRAWVAW